MSLEDNTLIWVFDMETVFKENIILWKRYIYKLVLIAFSWNKWCMLHLQFFFWYTKNAYFIFKNLYQTADFYKRYLFLLHMKTPFCLVANTIFFVCFKAKLFPFLVSKTWTVYLYKIWREGAFWWFQAIVCLLMFCPLGFVCLHLNMPVFEYKGISYIS